MPQPLPNLTRGRLGRVDYDHLNTVFRAVESMTKPSADGQIGRMGYRSFVAKLLAIHSTLGNTYTVWTWRQVRVGATTIEHDAALIDSSKFTQSDGLAVQIDGGTASPNDLVVIHEIASVDGKSWYAFAKPTATAADTAVMLRITSATVKSANRWEYDVIEATISLAGTASDLTATGKAWNTYELNPFGNGLNLTQTLGSLTPAACQGYVLGKRIGSGLYVFHAVNPMTAACS
jgi:hypothetical protein